MFGSIGAGVLAFILIPEIMGFICMSMMVVFLGFLLYATISGIVESRIAIRAWWRLYFRKPKALGPRTREERKRRVSGWRTFYAGVIILVGVSLLVVLMEYFGKYVAMIVLVGVVVLFVGHCLYAGILWIGQRLQRRK
jgi:uncharacterized membrane protein